MTVPLRLYFYRAMHVVLARYCYRKSSVCDVYVSWVVFAYPDIRYPDIRIYPLILWQPKIRIS